MDMSARRFLEALYRAAGGRIGAGVDQHDVGKSVGMTLDETDAVVNELCDEGFVEVIGIGGDIAITEAGVQALALS